MQEYELKLLESVNDFESLEKPSIFCSSDGKHLFNRSKNINLVLRGSEVKPLKPFS